MKPGIYRIEFFWWERGGGDHGELYVARGAFANDGDTLWNLVGELTSAQSFAKLGVDAAGWSVVSSDPGGEQLTTWELARAGVRRPSNPIGIGWAGMMGNTYVMLADCIPADRTGTYMGIFNMFIVIPMLIQSLTMPLIYRPLLGGDPRNVLLLGGVLMIMGAAATLFIKAGNRAPVERKSFGG